MHLNIAFVNDPDFCVLYNRLGSTKKSRKGEEDLAKTLARPRRISD